MITYVNSRVSINVYQMYLEFGRKTGFWLWRITWGNTIAKVTTVPELTGRHPYYNDAEIRADIYDIHTGALKEKDAVIPVPGTFKTWRMAQPPSWSTDAAFDPASLWVPLYLPYELNKKARSYGGRWSELMGQWVIKADDAKHLKKAEEAGFLKPPTPVASVYFDLPYANRGVAKEVHAKWEAELNIWSLPVNRIDHITNLKDQGVTLMNEAELQAYLNQPMVGFNIPSWERFLLNNFHTRFDNQRKIYLINEKDEEAIAFLEQKGFAKVDPIGVKQAVHEQNDISMGH